MDAKPARRGRKKRQSQLPQRVDTVDTDKTVDMCQHCGKAKISRPKRLCSACYCNLEIRRQYPSQRAVDMSMFGLCLHCDKNPATRPRGLCRACYHDLEIRKQYKTKRNQFCTEARGSTVKVPPLPQPTRNLPGTEAKFLELIERASSGYQLFHPDDAKRDLVGDRITANNKSFPVAADPCGDVDDECDTLPDMPRVDVLNHRRASVAECMSYLRGSKARLDRIASVGVAQAVGADSTLDAAVEADAGSQPPDVMAETVLEPGIAVGVDENSVGLADALEREQQADGERVQPDDPRPAGPAHGLVLGEDQVRVLACEPAAIPGKLPHFAGTAAGAEQEQQRPFDFAASPFHQRPEFVVGRRPAGISDHAAQGPGAAVGARRDYLLVPCPPEARQHARHRSPLGIHSFPFRVSCKKFGQIVLAKLRKWPVAKLLAKICEIGAVSISYRWCEVSAFNPPFDVGQVNYDDIKDGLRSILHGELLRKLDSG